MYYIARTMLGLSKQEAWSMTPYQILKLFKYHKEYNPLQFDGGNTTQSQKSRYIDDIDKALGGF
jgi:hypothetical protein